MKKVVLALCAFSLVLNLRAQVTINITPDRDNSIYSESNNSGGDGPLFSGETCSGNSRRALIHFDVAGNLPAGATITAVTLTLEVEQVGGSPSTNNYSISPLTANWGEGTSAADGTGSPAVAPDATWNDGILGTPWTSAGGDFSASVATTSLGPVTGSFNWSSAGMLTNVQNWYTTPATNFGWILIGDESTTCSARIFGSKESGTAPVLSVTYSCATPPTASCQNVVAYLDDLGQYTVDGIEVDNGSVANCGGPLTFSVSPDVFDCSDIIPSTQSLILTAIYDGNLAGGLPKGVEIFAANDIADLSIYGLGSATNGGGTDGQEFTFPAVSVSAGTYIYVSSEIPGFTNFFGFAPDYVSAAVSINGDDAVELFENGTVIDVYGEQTWTAGPHPWFYTDGFAYRNINTNADGSTFVPGNWTLSGINALDPALTNATAPIPVPIGTYISSSFIPVTLTVTDAFTNTATCTSAVIVFDTLAPVMDCIAPTIFNLDGTGNLTLAAGDIDNATTDGCGIASMTISQTAFDCSDLGLNQITLTATDNYGNTDACVADVTIQMVGGLTITEDASQDITCNGDNDGSISTTITGGTSPYIIDWDNDGTGDNDDLEDLTGLGDGTYTLNVSDQSGCTAQLIVVISEPALIDATLVTDNISCVGELDGAIDMTVTGGTGAYLFDWDNDGTGDTDDTEDLTSLTFGNYEVEITDANGCSALFNATIFDATPVNIGVTQTGFSLAANATSATYQWIVCPGNTDIAGATNATFDATVDGDYAVIVTDGNGCEDTSACYAILGLSTGEMNTSAIHFYPNPATEFIILDLPDFTASQVLQVMDANGRIVLTQTVNSNKEILNVSQLESGVYFIAITSVESNIISKFTIAR
ncbi:MAG: DNRLRE domain-containing protein [Crocinitomicaceae bacterium]|nr:DNRLRE domain-containing protein [Crocinitomicaceae bacterium]